MAQPHKYRREPQRLPAEPVVTSNERAGAGCLGLFVFPWFVWSLFSAVIGAGMPLIGFEGWFSGLFTMMFTVPIAIVLGSVSLTALARAFGSKERITITHRASAAVGASAVGIFSLAAMTSIVMPLLGSASGVAGFMAAVGGFVLLGAFAAWYRRARKRQPKRRKHAGPPKAPWAHPLARTERANMFGEALADEFSVITTVALAGLSGLLWNPLPLLIAGGLQMIWLALIPDSKWFRARVERKHAAMAQDQAAEVREEQLEFLTPEQLALHRQIVNATEHARQAMDASEFPLDAQRLERVIDHHLWLMQLETYYAELDDPTKIRDLDKQIAAAEADIEGTDGRMKSVLESRLEILNKRREQLAGLAARVQEISDKRQTLAETVNLVAESALSSAGNDPLDVLDEVMFDLETAEDVVLDLHDDEEALEREIEAAHAAAQ